MFGFKYKQHPEDFAFLILKILKIFIREVRFFFKK